MASIIFFGPLFKAVVLAVIAFCALVIIGLIASTRKKDDDNWY